MSNSEQENASDSQESDFDPDDDYEQYNWPQRELEKQNDASACEEKESGSESENGHENNEDGSEKGDTSTDILRTLTRNSIREIYEILDKRREVNYGNALELNKEMQQKLVGIRTQIQKLQNKVSLRYAQNEERLIENMKSKKERRKKGIFGKLVKGRTFYIRGNTFFKDESLRNCPNNEDYTRRRDNGEIFPMDFELVARHIWSITDKMAIVRGIKEQIISEKSLAVRISNKNAQLTTLLEKVGNDFKIDWLQISSHNLRYRHSPTSCKAMWEVYLQPSLKHDGFTQAENDRLVQAALTHKFQNWAAIAKEVGRRSDYQCFLQYYTTMYYRGRWLRWDKKDDERLLKAIDAAKCNGIINWSQVAHQFPQKSKSALQQRYQYAINPSVSHEPFSAEEDLLLLAAVQEFGTNFAKMPRTLFPNRSIIQLRSRYLNTLQHRHKSMPWTLEDDKFLMEFVKENGISSWKKLEEAFDNRHTRISCRQRYYVIQRHLQKDANATLEQISRKKCVALRSDVTPKNWQQKVEQLRANPDAGLQMERPQKRRRSKKTSNDNIHTSNQEVETAVEFDANTNETCDKPKKRKISSQTEPQVDITIEPKNTSEEVPAKKFVSSVDIASLCAKSKETKNVPLQSRVKEWENSINTIGAKLIEKQPSNETIDEDESSERKVVRPARPTKKPIYVERLRSNGLLFHNFLKYAYNFQFERKTILDTTNHKEEFLKARECLGFQMPNNVNFRSYSFRISGERNMNGLHMPVERRQSLRKFLRNSAQPGTTIEPVLNSQVPPNFSTLATLRAICVLSADHKKAIEAEAKTSDDEKNKRTESASNVNTFQNNAQAKTSDDEKNKITESASNVNTFQNNAAIQRFRQRFRNLFFQAAVLSRLPPSSLENQSSLILPSNRTECQSVQAVVEPENVGKTTPSPNDNLGLVKTECVDEAETITPDIKTEMDLESYKLTDCEN